MSRKIQLAVKRLLDIAIAGGSLVVLSPFLILIAAAIRLDSAGPVFFVQERVGWRGRRFRMAKFRTMVRGAEQKGTGVYVSREDSRITRVGKILRRLSLDEVPQLWNVFLGQMSSVGPRPALPYHVELYSDAQRRRLELRPGITGWSQVNGRNSISWPERIEKDVWYVDNFSLWLDARILMRTPRVSLSGEGMYGEREKFFFREKDDIPVPPEASVRP